MTPKELYEWAVDNHCEDCDMNFKVDVGNCEVDLEIYDFNRPKGTQGLCFDISLY